MRGNLWPAGTISGGCAVRYSGLRSSGYEQGSNEGYEKNDSGAHAGIVVAIIPGSGNDAVAIRPGNQDCSRLQLNGTCVISNCLTSFVERRRRVPLRIGLVQHPIGAAGWNTQQKPRSIHPQQTRALPNVLGGSPCRV